MPYIWKHPKYRHVSYNDATTRPERPLPQRYESDNFADPPDPRFPGVWDMGIEVSRSLYIYTYVCLFINTCISIYTLQARAQSNPALRERQLRGTLLTYATQESGIWAAR